MDAVELNSVNGATLFSTGSGSEAADNSSSAASLFGLGQQILDAANQNLSSAAPISSAAPAMAATSASMPIPNFGGGGAPSPALPSGNGSTTEGANGYLDKLEQMLDYVANHRTDPSGPINLMAYLVNLSNAGVLNNPDVQAVLQGWNINGLIGYAMMEGAMSAFFFGYSNYAQGGDSMNAYISDVLSALGGSSDPTLSAMYNAMNQFNTNSAAKFIAAHQNGSDLYWTIGNIKYDWTNPQGDDQYFIEQLIGTTQNSGGSYQQYFDGLDNGNGLNLAERNYRVTALEELLAKYKNPEIVITLWLMMAYDQTFQGQEGGLSDTTNYLTKVTNNYATPLLTDAQSIGSMTDDQAADFVETLYNGTNLVNLLPQTSTIAAQWQKNVFNTIYNLSVPNTPAGSTLGTVMDAYLANPTAANKHQLALALDGLNQPAAGSTDPSTRPGFQTVINALTQGGALVTGTSKTVDTQVSTVANVDDQVVKLGSSLTSATGGGFVQLMMQIVQNQISK